MQNLLKVRKEDLNTLKLLKTNKFSKKNIQGVLEIGLSLDVFACILAFILSDM